MGAEGPLMTHRIDITDQRFGRLVAVRHVGCGYKGARWLFSCDCGNEHVTYSNPVRTAQVKSCGCLHREMLDRGLKRLSHGDAHQGRVERLWRIWAGMTDRCRRPKNSGFKYYGARGISVCPEWRDDYPAFRDWALANGYGDGLTIDRVDPDGNYEPGNCRWVSASENSRRARRPSMRPQQDAASGRFLSSRVAPLVRVSSEGICG
jgi:hypothetical protein